MSGVSILNFLSRCFLILVMLNGNLYSTITLSNQTAGVVLANGKIRFDSLSQIKGLRNDCFVCDPHSSSIIEYDLDGHIKGIMLSAMSKKIYDFQEKNSIFETSKELPLRSCDIMTFSDSEQQCYLRTFSNAILYNSTTLAKQATAIIQNTIDINGVNILVRFNSNALVYGDRVNSGALLYGDRVNSSSLVYGDRVNSNVYSLIRFISNASLYSNRVNSTALLYGDRINSVSLLYGSRITSNALVKNTTTIASHALAILQNSGDIAGLTDVIHQNSSAMIYADRVNSNALLYGDSQGDAVLIRTMSNALLYGDRVNSNALLALPLGGGGGGISNEFIPFTCSGPVYINTDHWFSSDATLTFSGSTIVHGNGHSITFARNNGFITVASGARVELRNIVLKDFSDAAFSLGSGAQLIFGDQTTLEMMYSQPLSKNLTFIGHTFMNGFGNSINLGSSTLNIVGPSSLRVQNLGLQGVQNHSINVAYDGMLGLQNTDLFLSQDYSFTSGRCVFENQVKISGGHEFRYTTTSTSMIKPYGTVSFENGTTLHYNPPVLNRDLFAMENATSVLSLHGATIITSTVGLRLTRGTLTLDSHNELFNDFALTSTEGFSFGNTIGDNDLSIVMLPGASLELKSGFLNYNNVNS